MTEISVPIWSLTQARAQKCMMTTEFAARIGVHPNTVRYWRTTGKLLPVARSTGGFSFYTEEQARVYLASQVPCRIQSRSVNQE